MLKQVLHSIWITLTLIVLCCACSPRASYYDYGTGIRDTIYKEVIAHKIINPELKRLLTEYNTKYRNDPQVEGTGLCIYCHTYTDSICYDICYIAGINRISGLIVCEPVEGKDVSLIMIDLLNYFSLPTERSIEILKDSNPEEYLIHKENQKGLQRIKDEFERKITLVISDFPAWHVVFDRNNNLLRVIKP
ncbi:MAG: hypothetical protein LBV26_03250 [Bacteroidales bacterium]|nr:hypothetical protein [Bacteroidales bacterium]